MAEEFDSYNSARDDLDNPASSAEAIVTHATNPLGRTTRAIYVGGAGSLVVRLVNDDNDTTFTAVPVGSLFPIRVTHVRAASTATALVALF